MTLSLIYTKVFFCFVLNVMHCWGALDFRMCAAPKYHGFSISAQSYEFCPPLAQLDNLDVKLSSKLFVAFGYQMLAQLPTIKSNIR